MGSSNENSAFGPVRNPVAPDRVPGGSSGGSAAVVAQGTAVVSLGSDTGGSIRQPASFCGVVGITPTYGRVSRYGLIAFASSLDHIGPFARNVKDAALLLQVIAGRDEMDSTSAFAPVPDYAGLLDGNVKGVRIGLPREYFEGSGQRDRRPDHARRRDAPASWAARCARSACPPPTTPFACYYIICTAEASSNLARYDGVRYTTRSERPRDADRHVPQHARRRLRRRVQAPHHAGHLRAERGLLRRLLPQGAEGPRADRARLRPGLRAGGRHRDARSRPSRPSSWARRSTIRWRCTSPTSTRSPDRWPASRA